MNILTIGVLAVLVCFAASGFRKGLVRKLAGIAALLLSAFLVSAVLPYITDFLKSETPIYPLIVKQCESVISSQVSSSLKKEAQGKDGSIDRQKVKEVMNQYGLDSSMVDGMTDQQLLELADQYLGGYESYLDQFALPAQEDGGANALNLTKIQQTKLIENLPVPEFVKEMMLNYNNREGYQKLEVDSFSGYVTHFFANIILNILAFIVTLVVVQMILWGIFTALNLFTRLPILHLLNKLGGLAIGIFQGVLAVWTIFLVISALSGTEVGITLMEMISESSILKPMYDSNLFMRMAAGAISGFL